MKITVCSGFSPNGRKEYGERFLSTFEIYWPAEVRMLVYTEETDDKLEALAPGMIRSLWDCEGARGFIEEFSNQPVARGQRFVEGMNWKAADRSRGYSFRYDALKFSRQCMIPAQAVRDADLQDGDILVWLDADVVSFKRVPPDLVPGLLDGADGCYLGRGKKHSEIGFWAVRINAHTRAFLTDLASRYTSRAVFQLKEWHSAFVWDRCREAAEAGGANFHDLTPGGHDHVWATSPLAIYLDHLKGETRKRLGYSPEIRRGK